MSSNPNAYLINGGFASSGNDNSVEITLNVPSHTVPIGGESVYIESVPAPSKWLGKQIRAVFQYNTSRQVPGLYAGGSIPVIISGTTYSEYVFFDVSRIPSGDIQFRVRVPNTKYPATSETVSAFTVKAWVRTAIGN